MIVTDDAHEMQPEYAGRILKYLYPRMEGTGIDDPASIRVTEESDTAWQDNGMMIKFNQLEFVPEQDHKVSNLNKYGWLYYPTACIKGACKLAVILHGCTMRGMDMALPRLGWPSIGYQNDIVLLFPEVATMCWDHRGAVSGDKYATNEGI